MLDAEYLRKQVEGMLTPERYRHSLCAQRRAIALAHIHKEDWYKAGIAGLLHDICHCMSPGLQLKYLSDHGILLDNLTLEHPPIWHAVTGAAYLRRTMGLRDREVLRAVRYHTTGRAGMSKLEKIVFLADKTGSDRDYPGAENLRALSNLSLNAGMRLALARTVEGLALGDKPMVLDTRSAYQYYSKKEQ